jgi:uncharacterized membrane protein
MNLNYNKQIVVESVWNYHTLAKESLSGRWGTAFVVGFVFMIVTQLPQTLIAYFTGTVGKALQAMNGFDFSLQFGSSDMTQAQSDPALSSAGALLIVYSLLCTGAFSLGIAMAYLNFRRSREVSGAIAFDGFGNFLRALGLFVIQSILIFLWSLLFIIPGIIAIYRYSMAFMLLADNPNIGPFEALNMSKELMIGNKWKLFCLQLSFIGWWLLVALALAIVSIWFINPLMGDDIGMNVGFSILEAVVSAAGTAQLTIYLGTAQAAFYERVSGFIPPPYGQPLSPQ